MKPLTWKPVQTIIYTHYTGLTACTLAADSPLLPIRCGMTYCVFIILFYDSVYCKTTEQDGVIAFAFPVDVTISTSSFTS